MNRLEINTHFNKFSGSDYFVFAIDGASMDVILHKLDSEGRFDNDGVVPTLLNWLDDPKERKVVWSRIIPEPDQTTLAPILMCSEDVDLLCTVVVAEVHRKGDIVRWKRIGIDVGSDADPEMIGDEMRWFEGVSYEFGFENYKQIIEQFKAAL